MFRLLDIKCFVAGFEGSNFVLCEGVECFKFFVFLKLKLMIVIKEAINKT